VSDLEFALHIGQGWYMDAAGRLHTEPVTAAATYELPGTVPFDAKTLKDVFKDLKGVLPDKNDAAAVAKWQELGIGPEAIGFLSTLGAAAGAAATAFGVVAFVFAVAKYVGLFSNDPDALSLKIDAVAAENRAFHKGASQEALDARIAGWQSHLVKGINAVKHFADQAKAYPFDTATLVARLQDMRAVHGEVSQAVLEATNPLSWQRMFDVNDYVGSWFWVVPWLRTRPENGPPQPFTVWGQGTTRQDHRMMLPVALYAAQTYALLARGITPEHRTTGEFRDDLNSIADQLSALATNLRAQGAAQIVYGATDFEHVKPDVFVGSDVNKFTAFTNITVGAVDLASDTDAYLRSPPVDPDEWLDAQAGNRTIRRGEMEFYWHPTGPYYMNFDGSLTYVDTMAAAAEANAIGGRRYPEVLVRSGYFQLVQQAALLRHLATEPMTSETVEGAVEFTRAYVETKKVTATSPPIPFFGVVTSPARQVRQQWSGRARASTQPLGHQDKIGYRVLLRSLPLGSSGHAVHDPDYGRAYRTKYDDTPGHPGRKHLVVEFEKALVLDEAELVARSSPDGPVSLRSTGPRTMTVDAFDWYVPEVGLIDVELERPHAVLGLLGAKSAPGPLPMLRPLPPATAVQDVAGGDVHEWLAWLESGDVAGERRHLARGTVAVTWSLEWLGPKLVVTVAGRPEDRNCVLFLVVEETLISGQRLHTAFPIPINNQITFVPRSFLDEEERRWRHAHQLVDEMNRRFSESVKPRPGDPVSGRVHPVDLTTRAGIERVAAFFREAAPEVVQRVLSAFGEAAPRA
jgi:hypothetical protein